MSSVAAPEKQSKSWWGRKSTLARLSIVGVVVVAVGAISFVIANSLSKSPSSSYAAPGTEAWTDIADECINSEGNWVYYVIGTDESYHMSPALLASAPDREAAMAAYMQKRNAPKEVVPDVDGATAIFSRTYLQVARTLPKPAPGNQPLMQAYLTKIYLQAWSPTIEKIKSECSYSAAEMQRIAALPAPVGHTSSGGFTLP